MQHIGAALNNQSGEFGTVGSLNGVVLREQLSARGQLSDVGDALLRSAPMAGLVSGPQGSALRTLALPPLDDGLTQIFGATDPPNLAQYVPRSGWVAARLSLKLDTLISGCRKVCPPPCLSRNFSWAAHCAEASGFPTTNFFELSMAISQVPPNHSLNLFEKTRLALVLYVASLKDPAAADVFLQTLRTKLLEGEDRTFERFMERDGIFLGEGWADLSSDEN